MTPPPTPRDDYERRTATSRARHREAAAYLPGGDSRAATYHEPYPSYARHARACTLTTVDGDRLLDFHNNYTQTVLGHAPPTVVEAVTDRFAAGNGLGMPTTEITALARRLVERVPSLETVRFTNSGTEATMNAIRVAMAHTDREGVLKVFGGYHGSHDTVEVHVDAPGRSHRGIPADVESRVWSVPYNDPEALVDAFAEHGDDLACFVVEPVLGAAGMVPATTEYLRTARDLADDHGVPLVFDETISFRLDLGGAQRRYGVTPDLTALGKVIGGGLPVGAFGGRAELLALTHPGDGPVSHTGTFNANPATMAGGVATLDRLDEAAIDRLNRLGEDFRTRLDALETPGPVQVTGDGSLFQVHLTDEAVTDKATSTAGADDLLDLYFALRAEGVYLAPRGTGSLSTPMTTDDLDDALEAFRAAFDRLEA